MACSYMGKECHVPQTFVTDCTCRFAFLLRELSVGDNLGFARHGDSNLDLNLFLLVDKT